MPESIHASSRVSETAVAALNPFPAAAADVLVAKPGPQPPFQPTVTSASSSQNTFAALDTATPLLSTTWTHSASHHAEAGYLDPSLGWIGVRAEASGGALHAAIVPSSAQGADVLGAHLPALHAYVSQQHGIDSTIELSWQNTRDTGSGFQQSPQQDSRGSQENDPTDNMPGPAPALIASPRPVASFVPSGAPPPVSGGRYVSVLA